MLYWIIMALLCAFAIGLIVSIVITLKKNKQESYDEKPGRRGRPVDEYDEEEEYTQPVRRAQQRRQSERVQEEMPRRNAKKQWKVILENLETWEKSSFIFYDNIGIGRSHGSGEFEKFLTLKEDPRVSKIHCAIIRKEDKLYLKDMGSRNGTFLNGKQIRQPVIIQRDDIIGIGETKIEVQKVLRERD